MRLSTRRNRRRLGVFAGLLILAPIFAGSPARGTSVDDKKADAARISRQLEEQGTKLSANTERFNQARLKLSDAQASMTNAKLQLGRADDRMKTARNLMSSAAVIAYVHGGDTNLLSHLLHSNNADLVLRHQYLRFTAADQSDVLDELRAARQDLTSLRAKLAGEQKAAQTAADAADAARKAAADAEAAQRNVLSRVKGDLADLVAQDAARREAATKNAPAQLADSRPRPGGGDGPSGGPSSPPKGAAPGPPPPTARGAAAAVAEARRQIGKPYAYGAAGPDSFDCSGLTMWAWRVGGVSLSHSAYTQYVETTRVSPADMQPGDLLFFGPSVAGIHHNAIYAGNGTMIEASQTGVPVRYRALGRSDLVGVGRPG